MKKVVLLLATVAVLLAAGCASGASTAASAEPAPFVQQAASQSEINVSVGALRTTIVDWRGRAANAAPIPEWIQDVALDNFDGAARKLGQQAGGQGAAIYRGFIITGPDLRGAEMRSDANFARVIAKELQTNVNTYLASSANSMSGPTTEAIKEITQTKSEVTISGAQIVSEFWQVADVTDNNRTNRETILYRFYRFAANDWAAITGGYVQKVLDQLPQRLQPEQKDVMEMLQHTLNQSRAHEGLTLQEKQNQLDAQQKMIGAQIALMPAQQRDATDIQLTQARNAAAVELANINAETDRTVGVANARAQTASDAERAAYASQSSVLRAAASTTTADIPSVDAARMALRLIF